MNLTTELARPEQIPADWLVVGLWEGEPLTTPAAEVDAAAAGMVTRLLARGDCTGKAHETTPLYEPRGL
ncbi:MAG: hypothetical protein NZO58_10010, partial [Gemmataceae bacterium]|nr:hypothetical protein [Gemmataceae bacterium]